ncbi:hypothetical protein GIB67_018742 [Kingdonia uniflora]|uniref:Uncharacterized protein n=1 Tax=Kingdonia uniflora TaxID=39325 RepID=A0A7J7LSJ7_9MAGN|nr:hypothetical protein GIB67_018742 [Kingdonia uniflora]
MLVPISALLRHQAKASLHSSSHFSTLVPTEVVPKAAKLSCGSDQPETPSTWLYKAPTLNFDWSKTHGGNYSEPGTPQLSCPAYGTQVVVACQSEVSPLSGFTTKYSFCTGSCCIIELIENFPLQSSSVMGSKPLERNTVILLRNMSFSVIIRVESEDSRFSMLDCIKFAQLLNFTYTVGSKRLKMKLQKSS